MNNISKEQIIEKLGLEPLEGEGGYFRNVHKSKYSSAIFYLVSPGDFSALHRLDVDEMFHFYLGDPVEMIQISEDGNLKKITLGSDLMGDMKLQVLVETGVWQGTCLQENGKWALLGTTCAPAFEFDGFELGDRADLSTRFPQHKKLIEKYTRAK